MEQPPGPLWNPADNDAGRRLAQLAQVRGIVAEMAGHPPVEADETLDRSARTSAAYQAALPIVQKRFDALAAETAVWAAAAAEALLQAGERNDHPSAPAARLATELAKAQRQMERLLGL